MKVKLAGGSKRITIVWRKSEKHQAGRAIFERNGEGQEVPDDVGEELLARKRSQRFVREGGGGALGSVKKKSPLGGKE